MRSESDTIAAIATATGQGAVALVRVSGPDCRSVLANLTGKPLPEPRKATLRRLYNLDGEEVDQGIVTFYAGPASYTGEDCVEVSCHGGIASTRAVYQAVLQAGSRPAQPGEFTRRAFVNGKMDMAQAEAVNLLILARTRMQQQAAVQALEGAMARRISGALASLTAAVTALEASIDFPEDVEDPDCLQLAGSLARVRDDILDILRLAERGQMLQSGIRLAIVGRPNAGKSSILNLLAGRPRAIVSDIPGTTRDYLEETVEIGGLPVLAVDTAGIRKTDDPIEQEGARRAVEALDRADLALVVIDSTKGAAPEDIEIAESAREKCVIVWNKTDLIPLEDIDTLSFPGWNAKWQIRLSAATGQGLDGLLKALSERLGTGAGFFEEAIAATSRQVGLLSEAGHLVAQALENLEQSAALDLTAVSVQAARARLGEITGENITESLIDSIFGNFCIGK